MRVDRPTWVFGYGSLIWKQDFPFLEARPGRVTGWARRFWQGSHDHRGVEEDPGRVLTLIAVPDEHCEGMAFLVESSVFEHLDYREKNGYQRIAVDIALSGATVEGITYRAPEHNAAYLGPASPEEMASQINRCAGPSGSNREYVLELARALRRLGIADRHVFEVESWILQQRKSSLEEHGPRFDPR
jgi:cation transport protein ChaC